MPRGGVRVAEDILLGGRVEGRLSGSRPSRSVAVFQQTAPASGQAKARPTTAGRLTASDRLPASVVDVRSPRQGDVALLKVSPPHPMPALRVAGQGVPFIETNADNTAGMSGGPTFDLRGKRARHGELRPVRGAAGVQLHHGHRRREGPACQKRGVHQADGGRPGVPGRPAWLTTTQGSTTTRLPSSIPCSRRSPLTRWRRIPREGGRELSERGHRHFAVGMGWRRRGCLHPPGRRRRGGGPDHQPPRAARADHRRSCAGSRPPR